MAQDPNSLLGQLDTAYSALATYFSTSSAYLAGTSPTLPSLTTLLAGLDYSEVLREVRNKALSDASFSSGAASDAVHLMVAIKREVGIVNKMKSTLYQDGASEVSQEAAYSVDSGNSTLGDVQGLSTAAE